MWALLLLLTQAGRPRPGLETLPRATVLVDSGVHQLVIQLPPVDVPAAGSGGGAMVGVPPCEGLLPPDASPHSPPVEGGDRAGRRRPALAVVPHVPLGHRRPVPARSSGHGEQGVRSSPWPYGAVLGRQSGHPGHHPRSRRPHARLRRRPRAEGRGDRQGAVARCPGPRPRRARPRVPPGPLLQLAPPGGPTVAPAPPPPH